MIVDFPVARSGGLVSLAYSNLTAPVAQRISHLRRRSRVSRHDLAILLDSTDEFVARLEQGGPAITPKRVRRVARALGVREELFYPRGRPDIFWDQVDSTLDGLL